MPTTFRGATADFYINSYSAVYATARSGSGSLFFKNTASDLFVGQQLGSSTYNVYRSYLAFDTSTIPDGDTVTAVSLIVEVNYDYSTTNFTMYCYKYDWDGAETNTNLWAMDTAGSVGNAAAAVKETPEVAITTHARNAELTFSGLTTAWVSKTGTTRYVLCSNRDKDGSGTAPTGNEYMRFYSADSSYETTRPALVVTHGAGGVLRVSRIFSQGVLVNAPFRQLG